MLEQQQEVRELVLGIESNVERVLEAARERAITPLRAARELAQERLDAVARSPARAA